MGRIVPAIATTTAAATGLVALELYKLCHGEAHELEVERFRARNINLAVNEYTAFEPKPCARKKTRFGEVDLWTVLTLRGDLTVREVVDYFRREFGFRDVDASRPDWGRWFDDVVLGGLDPTNVDPAPYR